MKNLALFDFDGTITTRDTFTPFIYFAVAPLRLKLGMIFLFPVLLGYKLRLLHARIARSCISRVGFSGRAVADIKQLGARYFQQEITKVLRPNALQRIKWHKDSGDTVVIVSASLDSYLSEWCRQQSLDLICTELEAKGSLLTGCYIQGDCSGVEKVKRIRERYDLRSFQHIYAYGDTLDDEPMLALADKKYFRWQEVSDVRAAAAIFRTGDPDSKSRWQEIEAENIHLDQLIKSQAQT